MEFYFAYGSNMNAAQMRKRCPDHQVHGRGKLIAHRIAFTHRQEDGTGAADVVACDERTIFGLVYRLSKSDFCALDAYEGVSTDCYHRHLHPILLDDATLIECWVYEVCAKETFVRPSKDYLERVVQGAKQIGVPNDYLQEILKAAEGA